MGMACCRCHVSVLRVLLALFSETNTKTRPWWRAPLHVHSGCFALTPPTVSGKGYISVTCIKMKLNFTAFHFPSNLECPDTYQVWRLIFVSDKIHYLTGRHHCWLVSSRGTEPAIVGEGFSTWLPLGFHFLMRSFGGCLSKLVISQVGVCVAKY